MFNINSYLTKFKNVAIQEIVLRETIVKSINERVKSTITIKDITLKNAVVTVKANPVIKGEIFIKKTLILEDLKKVLNEKVVDIR